MNMKKITSSILITLFVLCSTNIVSVAEENFKETELNIFTGMFDFGDDTQASGILGLQHQKSLGHPLAIKVGLHGEVRGREPQRQ